MMKNKLFVEAAISYEEPPPAANSMLP